MHLALVDFWEAELRHEGQDGMTLGFSLYLDVVRFILSLAVFLSHARSLPYTGEIFWRTAGFAQPAVIGFFVLSGFVIAHVTRNKERLAVHYTINRISRLYSVLIPCLGLTAIADFIGWKIFPEHYQNAPMVIGSDFLILRYIGGLLMASAMGILGYFQNAIGAYFPPGTEGPIWSLSNEIMYYAFFGFYWFANGKISLIMAVILSFIAGPSILMLFPIWIGGFRLYDLCHRTRISPPAAGIMFMLSSVLMLVICLGFGPNIITNSTFLGRAVLEDYSIGLLMAANIYAASNLGGVTAALLMKFAPLVRWLGAMTYPLYLTHRPLLQLLSGFRFGEPGSLVQTVWLFGCILVATIIITVLSNRLRFWMRQILGSAAARYMPTLGREEIHVVAEGAR